MYPDATHEITHSQGPGSSDDSAIDAATAPGDPAPSVGEPGSPKASGGAAALGFPDSCPNMPTYAAALGGLLVVHARLHSSAPTAQQARNWHAVSCGLTSS